MSAAENGNGRVHVSEQRLQDALAIHWERSRGEHTKTRLIVMAMTGPVWGQTIMAAAGLTAGLITGGVVTAIGVAGSLLVRR